MKFSEISPAPPDFFIMSDQPDTCGYCGSRLEFIELKKMEGEEIFVSECLGCKREILMVEN